MMNTNTFIKYKKQECTIYRFTRVVFTILGAIFLFLLFFRYIEKSYNNWSPTITAKNCFYYPNEPTVIDKEKILRYLLSAAFFGNDAFYFDEGEENTGVADFTEIPPTNIPDNDTPIEPQKPPQINFKELYSYDYSKLPNGMSALVPYDMSNGASGGKVLLSNATEYKINVDESINNQYPIKVNLSEYSEKNPLILIIHTHGTEAFSPEGVNYTPQNYMFRDSDITNNIVSVGAVMANTLNEEGIPTIHCTIMHDKNSYRYAYDYAADTIQQYISKYPSIKYVFDVHRDAITNSAGNLIKPITIVNNEKTAQIMLLVGTNEKGADHPNWTDNLTVAVKLQSRLTTKYERFARPINIRGASFNEQFTKGSLLIEIGSAANTLNEAKRAAKQLAIEISELIKDNAK